MQKTYKFSKIFLQLSLVTTLFSNDNYYALLDNISLQSLGEVQVYSATRELASVDEVPVVISVITAEDIKKKGYKNLTQVLQRIPGYYMDNPTGNVITTRGVSSEANEHNLLLIDGHSQNNVVSQLFGKKATWPILLNVKRVEIIRTPSSTLWGSDAALGIINIVTYTGSDLDKNNSEHGVTRISLDYESQTRRNIENILYGVKLGEKHDLAISATHWKNPVDVSHSYSGVGANTPTVDSTEWQHKDSYDMHAKYRYKDFQLTAHLAKADMLERRRTGSTNTDQQMQEEANWVELQWRPKINEHLYFENRVYYDDSADAFQLLEYPSMKKLTLVDRGHTGGGAEIIMHLKNKQHHLKVGLFGDSQELRLHIKNLNETTGVYEKSFAWLTVQDKNRALFIEEEYKGIEDWIFTIGGRWESNTPREETTNFLPRVAVVHTISDEWLMKYSYNTGYLRLSLGNNFGWYEVAKMPSFYGAHGLYEWVKSPTKSKETSSHDLQLRYKTDKFLSKVTLFKTTLDNLITHSGDIVPGLLHEGGTVAYWSKTSGSIESYGAELELTYKHSDKLLFNASYTYTDAQFDDDYSGNALENLSPLNVPSHLWNIGVDWDIRADLMLNLNYRGFGDIWTKLNDDSTTETVDESAFVETGMEHFVDMNLYYMPTDYINISLYAKNMTDNVGQFSNTTGYATSQLGREIGLEIQIKFF